jgi:hypothetical protein
VSAAGRLPGRTGVYANEDRVDKEAALDLFSLQAFEKVELSANIGGIRMTDVFASLGLQSGIVIGVLIAAVFLAERLGGDDVLLRRGTQIALAFAVALTVFAGTSAFIRPPDPPEDITSIGFGDGTPEEQEQIEEFARETAERDSESGTLHLGIGIALVAAGLLSLRRYIFLPISLLLGGTLLLLLGAPAANVANNFSDTLTALYSSYLPGRAEPGQTRDIAQFVVLLVGTALLFYIASLRWEAFGPEMVRVAPSEPEPESLPDEY